jgi:hypothetical protein
MQDILQQIWSNLVYCVLEQYVLINSQRTEPGNKVILWQFDEFCDRIEF